MRRTNTDQLKDYIRIARFACENDSKRVDNKLELIGGMRCAVNANRTVSLVSAWAAELKQRVKSRRH